MLFVMDKRGIFFNIRNCKSVVFWFKISLFLSHHSQYDGTKQLISGIKISRMREIQFCLVPTYCPRIISYANKRIDSGKRPVSVWGMSCRGENLMCLWRKGNPILSILSSLAFFSIKAGHLFNDRCGFCLCILPQPVVYTGIYPCVNSKVKSYQRTPINNSVNTHSC